MRWCHSAWGPLISSPSASQLRVGVGELKDAFADQMDFDKADERFIWIYESAKGRLDQIQETSATMANNEIRRIKSLPSSPLFHQLSPEHMGQQLQQC